MQQETKYGYDAGGNLLSRMDANQHATTYTYDLLNRLETRTLPGGGTAETYNYNPTGTVASVKDFNGKTTTFDYDAMDRLLARGPDASFAEPATTFTYYATGLRETMTDATGTTRYTYDKQNRLLSKATPFGTLAYTYDAAGNRLSMTSSNPNGVNVSYTYDELNRLKTVTSDGKTTTYNYDTVGNVSETVLPNGVRITPGRDGMDRVTSLPMTSAPPVNFGYTYGPVGNRLTADTTSYGYDAIYRLTSETRPSGALTYLLDQVGNRLSLTSTLSPLASQSFSYDAKDRIVGNSYDANGNTLTSGARTFAYDSRNRLASVTGAVTMLYDGDGNRVAKGATAYLVDDNNPTGLPQVVEEIAGGSAVRNYTYGLERISQTQFVNGAWVTSYYGYDGHGDVRFLTDASGAVTDTYEYDAWGNVLSSTGSTPNVYRYQGEQYDVESGLYYLRARYFDALTGRFLTTDPQSGAAAEPRSQHPYLYASADPVNGKDPRGEQTLFGYTLLLKFIGPLTWPAWRFQGCFGSLVIAAGHSAAVLLQAAKCTECDGLEIPGTKTPFPPSGQPPGPVYNCLAWALGFTDRWVQPRSPNESPNTVFPKFGCKKLKSCEDGLDCKDRTKVIVFEDPTNAANWHVMRQECSGTWSSKNGQDSQYFDMPDPEKFYRCKYQPNGEPRKTCWSCPSVPRFGGCGSEGVWCSK